MRASLKGLDATPALNSLRAYVRALDGRAALSLALAFLLYTVLALVVTYPLLRHFDTAVAGIRGDTFQHLWSLWWGAKALFDPDTSLTAISMLYFPQELQHPIMGITPWIQIAAAPFVALFGPITAYNIWFILSTVLAGVAAYLLAYEITADRRAAFVGGLIFAFAPSRVIHGVGHYAQIMTYLFPLYFLFLLRALNKPSLKNAILAGLLLTLSLLVNFIHIAYFVIPGTLILVLYFAVVRRVEFWQTRRLFTLALAAGLAFLLTAPLFVPFILSAGSGDLGYLESGGVSYYGADLLAFVTPSSLHPFFKNSPELQRTLHRIVTNGYRGDNITEGLVYLGYTPLLLAAWAVLKRKETARPWLVVLLVSALFSLGPLLRLNGDFATYEVDDFLSYFVMPYALLTKLPLFELARTPGRINALTTLALAILASIGLSRVLIRWPARAWASRLLPAVVSILIAVEYIAIWPYPVAAVSVPQFYTDVASEPGQFAILDHPMYLQGFQSAHSFDMPMYYQLFHNRPIAGGYIWRLPPEAGGTMRALDNLVSPRPRPDISPAVPATRRAQLLDDLGFRYVVVHKVDTQAGREPLPQERLTETVEHISGLLGPPVFEDDAIVAFRVPQAPATPPSSEILFLTPGENWLESEFDEEEVWRWSTGRENSFFVYGQGDGEYRLTFRASSVDGPRRVDLAINGAPLGQLVVDRPREFLTPAFTLSAGQNKIAFSVQEPCRARDPRMPLSAQNPCVNVRVSAVELVDADILSGAQSVNCLFADKIELLAYETQQASSAAGESIALTLYWQARVLVEESYTVFTHLRDEDGHIYAQQDGQPMQGAAPTSTWRPGEIIVDRYTLDLPQQLPAETDLFLTTGLYLLPSGERLQVDPACPVASPEQHVTLNTFESQELAP